MTVARATQPQLPAPLAAITSNDRLGLTIFFAIVLHSLIILGISFSQEDKVKPPEKLPGLEVTLVQSRTDKEIEDADFLAQANQDGGGESETPERPSTPVDPVVPTGQIGETAAYVPETAIPKASEAKTMQIMTADFAKNNVDSDEATPEMDTKQEQLSPIQLLSRSKEIAKLSAEIDQSRRAYASRPRKAFVSAKTKKYEFANYEEAWRKKVERIGTLNFPDKARRNRLSGSLRMAVTMNPDGTIENIKITKFSGHKILDDAAVRIVKMAAPFPKFSEDLRNKYDEMVIIRTWQFLQGSKLKTQR